jgi:hypothetical protein
LGTRPAAVFPLLALALLAAACSSPPPRSEADRTVTDEGLGIRYTLPDQWSPFLDEIRSPGGTVWELKTKSLEDAEKGFLAGLPRTILPQLGGWTEFFYKRNGEPALADTVIGGHPALEAVFPVMVRPGDPPTAVAYWAVRHGDTLYVFRAGFPPGREALDLPALRQMMQGLTFLRPEPPPAEPDAPPGQVVQ